MKSKIIEAKIVDGFVAIFENKDTCMGQYYAEDDWDKSFYDTCIASLREKCSRFDARHDGTWETYETKLIQFELDGKEFSIEIEDLRKKELPKIMGMPLINGHQLISTKIYNQEKRILAKETEERMSEEKQKEKMRQEKEEKALYNKLKKKFEKKGGR